MHRLFPFIVLLAAPAHALAQVSVGWDNDCDYNVATDPQALQTALDAETDEIRLTYQNDYQGIIEINRSVQLRGGFIDCAAANSNSQDNIRAVLNGTGLATPVISIEGIEDADVRLELLTIKNGDGSNTNQPGGMDIDNLTGTVALDQLDIRENSGSGGGGISLNSSSNLEQGSLDVVITRTAIRDNTANRGGGVSCDTFHSTFDLQIHMSQGTTLRDNHAEVAGGAIHMQGCTLDFEAGIAGALAGSNLDAEIFRNTSQTSGAGITLFNTARVILRGTTDQAFDLSGNTGNLDESTSGAGGAAQVGSGAELEIINGNIVDNSTGRYGGGLFASFGGKITVRRDSAGCSYDGFCSRIVGNRLTRTFPGGGGALAARFGGQISVYNTFFWLNNSDDRGYIGFAEQSHDGQNASLLLEGNLIVENGQLTDNANSTLIDLRADAHATLAYNTFYRNKSNSTILSQSDGSSLLAVGNILDEFGDIHQPSAGADVDISCNLVRSLDSIEAPVTDTFEGTPAYIDSSTFDFRLAESDTLAMDICSADPYLPGADIDGQARGLDRMDVSDLNGPFDLGAWEFNPESADRIFSDAFGSNL